MMINLTLFMLQNNTIDKSGRELSEKCSILFFVGLIIDHPVIYYSIFTVGLIPEPLYHLL